MKFVIVISNNNLKTLIEWPNEKIKNKIKQRLGIKGVKAFEQIIKEFKEETIKLK